MIGNPFGLTWDPFGFAIGSAIGMCLVRQITQTAIDEEGCGAFFAAVHWPVSLSATTSTPADRSTG